MFTKLTVFKIPNTSEQPHIKLSSCFYCQLSEDLTYLRRVIAYSFENVFANSIIKKMILTHNNITIIKILIPRYKLTNKWHLSKL